MQQRKMNVRELRQTLIEELLDDGMSFDAEVETFKVALAREAIKRFRGNKSKAARRLGMHRNTLSRMVA